MNNTPKANLEFQITFTETNLRWELGSSPPDQTRIKAIKKKISELKKELALLP
jgi:hypothetical protein